MSIKQHFEILTPVDSLIILKLTFQRHINSLEDFLALNWHRKNEPLLFYMPYVVPP